MFIIEVTTENLPKLKERLTEKEYGWSSFMADRVARNSALLYYYVTSYTPSPMPFPNVWFHGSAAVRMFDFDHEKAKTDWTIVVHKADS